VRCGVSLLGGVPALGGRRATLEGRLDADAYAVGMFLDLLQIGFVVALEIGPA
jgi:hypothetical protein